MPAILGLFAMVSLAEGLTVRRVPADYPTIQAAINAVPYSVGDDTVLVAPGTYYENLNSLGKHLALVSEAGPSMTVVDGGGLGRVLVLTGGSSVEGFTIRHGGAPEGGGIRASGGGLIRNCIIEDNVAGSPPDFGTGGGIRLIDGGFQVLNCIIRNNHGEEKGGGIAAGVGNEIRDNVFSGNYSTFFGAAIYADGACRIISNLIIENSSVAFGPGAIVFAGADGSLVEGNTITHNAILADFSRSIVLGGYLRRNIVADNRGVGLDTFGSRTSPGLECNNSWNNMGGDYSAAAAADTAGGRNFSLDPLFCAPSTGDYHISTNSPCAPTSPSGCELIGALPPACGLTALKRTSWGALKIRYR